jgi:hypothetical protein
MWVKSEGKKARILTDNSKLYRVGIEYPDIIEARKALEYLKKKHLKMHGYCKNRQPF